ncbi:aldo-keto reductase, partial [Reticulomyxa filosa]
QKKKKKKKKKKKGLIFPMITLGTGGLNGKTSYQVIKEAVLQFNYTAIDSARLYESETAVGTLMTENKKLRSRLFLVSKVAPTHLYFQAALDSVQQSLLAMKTNNIDLYTIHWPVCDGNLTFVDCRDNKDGKWQQAYDALSKLYGEGVILNIGLSFKK